MVSSPDIPLLYYSLIGILTCLGETERSLVLNSYLLTSDTASVVRTLVDRYSSHSYVNLVYR